MLEIINEKLLLWLFRLKQKMFFFVLNTNTFLVILFQVMKIRYKTQDFGLLYSKLQNSLHKTFIQNTHSRRQCQEGTSNKSHGGDMVVQKMCIYSFIAD